MSQVEFFKATSKGLDPIENSKASLHSRRSLIIKDDINTTLWLIHGSSTAKTTRSRANKSAEKINKENHGAYDIIEIDYDDAENKIDEILNSSSDKSKLDSKVSISSIPTVPEIKRIDEPDHLPVGDVSKEGPELEEFQISYYLERDSDTDPQNEIILEIISDMEREIKSIMVKKPNKSNSKKKLRDMVDNIINLIYQ